MTEDNTALTQAVDVTNGARIVEIEERNILNILEQISEIDQQNATSDEIIAQCQATIQSHRMAKKVRTEDRRRLSSRHKILQRARLELHLVG